MNSEPQLDDTMNTTSDATASFDFGGRPPGRFPWPVNTPTSALLGRYRFIPSTKTLIRDSGHWKPGASVFSKDGTEYIVGPRGQLLGQPKPSWCSRREARRNRAYARKMNWDTGIKFTRAELSALSEVSW